MDALPCPASSVAFRFRVEAILAPGGDDDVRSTTLERRVVGLEGGIWAGDGVRGGDSPSTKPNRSSKSPLSKGSGDSDSPSLYCEYGRR